MTNAYARLFAEGWLEGRHGSGTYVADVADPPRRPPAVILDQARHRTVPAGGADTMARSAIGAARRDSGGYGGQGERREPAMPERLPPREITDLQPGISWADGIEPAAWRRAWRQAGAHLPSRWPDPYGLPELREAIAAYLRRSRGLAVGPEQVLITQGVSSGLALLADVTPDAG